MLALVLAEGCNVVLVEPQQQEELHVAAVLVMQWKRKAVEDSSVQRFLDWAEEQGVAEAAEQVVVRVPWEQSGDLEVLLEE